MTRQQLYTLLLALLACILLSSCGVQRGNAQLYDPKEVAQLSKKIGVQISNQNKEDVNNMALYAESSLWLGTRYKYGGNSKQGIDCSALVQQIYKKAYRMKIPRSTADLDKMKQTKVTKGNLRTGDLIFFATSKNKKKTTHIGIYLKEDKFVHASTSNGVIVSDINEAYYKKTWRKAGRIR